MKKNDFLDIRLLQENIKSLKSFMKKEGLQAFYLSSNDIFLNEYVPLKDCHRYYLTKFTGSTAEALVPLSGKVILFVDGRYYEQADIEADSTLIEVYKCPYGKALKTAVEEEILNRKFSQIGLEGDRVEFSFFQSLKNITKIKSFNNAELSKVIQFESLEYKKDIRELSLDLVGETTSEKLKKILKPGEAFFTSALDSIAWLTNMRRHELPNQSTFRSKALLTYDRVYLFMEHIDVEIKNPAIELFVGDFSKIENFFELVQEHESFWLTKAQIPKTEIEKIYFSSPSLNAADYNKLVEAFNHVKLIDRPTGLVPFHALKNPAEIKAMESSFNRGDQAIYETIKWAKNQVAQNQKITELDFFHKTNEFYKSNGAFDQSFKTIAAVGANSSIIHFSSPSAETVMEKNKLVLLDSGGYFESGFATDTTRAFLSGGVASVEQKKIYTLVLKSFLHTLNAVFPENTWGSVVDGVARQPLFKYGHNFNHGTGHGVGINVHEGGYRLSTTSNVPLKENTVGSIEPGIYLPGFGGVRLENVAVVEKHPTLSGMLHFRSLVFIGFDPDLIDESLMTAEEIKWLQEYEDECSKRGRSFRAN